MLRVGTSGYSYPAWRGTFYPERLPARAMLAFYATHFSTVEINATFYRMPAEATVRGWAAAVPADFLFALKAPQRITHLGRLLNVDEPLRHFCDLARALGERRGPILFQLPPSFRKDVGRLADLLARIPPDLRVAVEFRHPSWFADDVYAVLARRDVALCVADTEKGTTPDVETAAWGYLRLRDAGYSDDELTAWAARVARPRWRDAFVYFKHEESGRGPALASRLLARARGRALR